MNDQPLPLGFSITAYQDDPSEEQPPTGHPASERLRLGLRLAAAVLAVLAAWANVLVQTVWLPDESGDPHGAGFVRYTYNGWGHARATASQNTGFEIAPIGGPNFGVLLCVAAAGLLVAAASGWLPNRLRWQPPSRILTGLAAAFLLGVVACEVATALPYHQASVDFNSEFRIGWCPWLGAIGCLLAVLSCLPWPIRRSPAGGTWPDQDSGYAVGHF